MSYTTYLESSQNPIFKGTLGLIAKARKREASQEVFVEGKRECEAALAAKLHPLRAFFHEGGDPSLSTPPTSHNVPRYELSSLLSERLFMRTHSQSFGMVFAYGPMTQRSSPENLTQLLNKDGRGCFLAVDGLEHPGNLGAMARSADASGVKGLISAGARPLDTYHPAAIRNSMGTCLTLPSLWYPHDDLIGAAQAANLKIYVATPSAQAKSYTEVNFTSGCIFLLGSESKGLHHSWSSPQCEHITIPMSGRADSLNLSVASALLAFEYQRQLGLPLQ